MWLRNSGEIELSVCKLWLTRCCQPRWLHFQWNHLKFWNRGMWKCNNVLSARINQNHKFQGSHLLSMLKIGFHVVGFSWHLKICHDYALCPCDSFWRSVILVLIFNHKMPKNAPKISVALHWRLKILIGKSAEHMWCEIGVYLSVGLLWKSDHRSIMLPFLREQTI